MYRLAGLGLLLIRAVNAQADVDEEASKMAADIVRGLTESFLGKSVTSQERYCLAGGAGKLAGGIADTSMTTVTKLHELFGNVKGIAAQTGYLGPGEQQTALLNTPTPLPFGQPYPTQLPGFGGVVQESLPAPVLQTSEAAVTTVELARLTAIELAHTLTSMFGFEHQLTKSCLSEDAQATFEKARQNLGNMSYVGGHLVANGVTIVDNMADAVEAYDGGEYRTFGTKVGTAWRKVLLAKGESSTDLTVHVKDFLRSIEPDKLMEEMDPKVMEQVLQGFVGSMFGNGFSVNLEADATPSGTTAMPFLAGWTPPNNAPHGKMTFQIPPQAAQQAFGAGAEASTNVSIDLHTCIGGNMELFSSAWEPVVGLSEQFMSGHCTGSVGALCMSLWTVVLTDIQEALRTCGFTPEQEKILLHSMWAGKLVHANISLPEEKVQTTDVTVTMANAVEDWRDKKWSRFGEQLGDLCRETVVVAFPQQWSIDETGHLRQQLQDSGVPGITALLGVPSLLLLLVASLVIRRSSRSHVLFPEAAHPLGDMEVGDNALE